MLSLLSIRELNEKLSRDCAKKSKNEWEWKNKLKYAYTIQIQEQETEFNNFNQGNWNCLIENLVIYIGTTKYVSLIFRFCSFLFRLCTGAELRPTTQKSHRSESWHPIPNPSGITTQNIHDYYLLWCLLCVLPLTKLTTRLIIEVFGLTSCWLEVLWGPYRWLIAFSALQTGTDAKKKWIHEIISSRN